MKCSQGSLGMVQSIKLCCDDMVNDKSTNTLEQTLELIESQVLMIRTLEELPKK